MKVILTIILSIISLIHGSAQVKYEKEIRVKETEVPATARNIAAKMTPGTPLKWYKEFGKDKTSFEAKSDNKGARYSIEFSEAGIFEDLEIEIKSDEIPSENFNKILARLSEYHNKYSITKIQVQYSGAENLISEYIKNQVPVEGMVIKYEIVVSCKMDGVFKMIEYLFSEDGNFLQKAEIKLKSTDNLEY